MISCARCHWYHAVTTLLLWTWCIVAQHTKSYCLLYFCVIILFPCISSNNSTAPIPQGHNKTAKGHPCMYCQAHLSVWILSKHSYIDINTPCKLLTDIHEPTSKKSAHMLHVDYVHCKFHYVYTKVYACRTFSSRKRTSG